MAEKIDPKGMVSFEELLKSTIFAQDALVNLLEKKGIITKAELLKEALQESEWVKMSHILTIT